MRNTAVVALISIFLLSFAANGLNKTTATIESWNVDIAVHEDRSAKWTVDVFYKDVINRDEYWVFAQARNVEVTTDDNPVACAVTEPELGTLITCSGINGRHIKYSFESQNFASVMNDKFNIISYTFSATKFADKFSVSVTLPLGAVLADKARLPESLRPFEPSFGREGSDGRLIFVKWELVNPRLGEAINVRIIYEPLINPRNGSLSQLAMIGLIVIAVLMVFGVFWRLRMRTENILPVLNKSERLIVEMLMKQNSLDQRDIVKTTDFSKAKVSRVLQSLAERSIVEVTPKGRTKKIKLILGQKKHTESKTEPEKKPKVNLVF